MALTSACFIVESGTDVRLVEGLAERFQLSILARRIEGGVEINHPPMESVLVTIGPASRIKFALHAWKYLRAHRHELDSVIVQGYGLAALAANFAGRFNHTLTIMLVCSPVESYYRCRKIDKNSSKPFLRYELWVLQVLARLNALIGQQYVVLSQYLANVVRQHGTRVPIEIIPIYGVETSLFTPSQQSKIEIKAQLGLPTSGNLIFFSSRIAPEKDSETLLLAFKILLESGRDLWLLHRSGGYRAFIKNAERLGVAQRIIATDAVHPHYQLPMDYQACDLCVQASCDEGLGFSPLEALSCEIPAIATAVGGLKETIIDGQTGWTYLVRDVASLSKCIENALDNPVEAARRAALGREMVCAKYNRQAVFNKLEGMVLRIKESNPQWAKTH